MHHYIDPESFNGLVITQQVTYCAATPKISSYLQARTSFKKAIEVGFSV
jgi:hypothetical protein